MIMQGNKHILFVENNLTVAKPVSLCMESAGYKVFVAQSPSQAERVLKDNIIHAMIVDKRLGNDKDPEDALGFTFAKKRSKNIPCIVFTAYDEGDTLHQAWKELGAVDFISKEDPQAIEHLLESLKTALDELHCNFDLKISSTPPLDGVAKILEFSRHKDLQPPTADDLERVLQTLFYQADQVKLNPLLSQKSIQRTESYLMIARQHRQEGWCSQEVVKFAAAEEIEIEKQKYAIFTPLLGGQRIPQLKESDIAFSHDLGGLVYSLVREDDLGDIIPFETFYQNHSAEEINMLLENFFRVTFSNLYKDAPRVYWDIFQTYAEQLRLTPDKLIKAAKDLRQDLYNTPLLHFDGLSTKLPNPVSWVLVDTGFRPMERLVRHCFVHGDLHGRNMLVDKNENIWLIDFERATDSHALRDFVELETDIKFNLLQQTEMATLYRFENVLLELRQFDDPAPSLRNIDANTQKAYQVICHLRRVAGYLIQTESEMQEYYEALFIHTLNILRLKHITPQKKEHALMAASLLCQLLDNWTNPKAKYATHQGEEEQEEPKTTQRHEPTVNIDQMRWSGFFKLGFVVLLLILSFVAVIWATTTFSVNWGIIGGAFIIVGILGVLILPMTGLASGNRALQSLEKISLQLSESLNLGNTKEKKR
jgi:DNA-binding response OmpR family regulator